MTKGKLAAVLRRCPSGHIRACIPASLMVGLAATVVREGSPAGVPVQLAEWQPKFPRQGNQLASWVQAQNDETCSLILAVSCALSSVPTAHRWLFSTCWSQKQNLGLLRRNIKLFASGLQEMCNSDHTPVLGISIKRSRISDFLRSNPALMAL